MAQAIRVKARQHSLRGQRVAGADGKREYLVNAQTSELHAIVRGQVSADPGVHPDDVAEFKKFSALFEMEKRPPPAPPKKGKKTPPPPPAPGGAGEPGKPDSSSGEPASPGALDADELRSKLANWSKKELLAEADALEIKGRNTMTKAELIEAIVEAQE